jgi:hypothetical protein
VVHRKTPDQNEDLPLDLVVTNEGDEPVRLCTLCTIAATSKEFTTSILMRPGGYDPSISPQELEKHTVTAKPGESVTIAGPTVTIMPKGEDAPGFDGKHRINFSYSVSKEFAEAHKTWQGHISASTIIELAGGAKRTEYRIKPGDRIYIYVKPSLPDNPIRATYEVEASGKVALGPGYGRVIVADMTVEEAEAEIQHYLAEIINNPTVSVSRTAPTPVTEGANPELERRVQQLEKELRALRSELDEIKKKPRGQ